MKVQKNGIFQEVHGIQAKAFLNSGWEVVAGKTEEKAAPGNAAVTEAPKPSAPKAAPKKPAGDKKEA